MSDANARGDALERGQGQAAIDDAYRDKGWTYVRGAFPEAEALAWRGECDRLFALPIETGPRAQTRAAVHGAPVRDRLDPVVDISEVFRDLAASPRILAAAAAAVGAPVRLLKEKLILKRPGTRGYGLHQDFPYWEALGFTADEIVTVLVAIDAADRENGAVELFPGLHRARLPAPPGEPRDADESCVDAASAEAAILAAGDLLVFHPLAPHRSAPNSSDRPRRTLFLTYVDARRGGDPWRDYYAMRDGA